jgi:hypothetical protein
MSSETVGGIRVSGSAHTQQHIPFFGAVVSFRAFWFVLSLVGLNAIVPLGTPLTYASTAAMLGVVAASFLARTRLNGWGFVGFSSLLWLVSGALFWIADQSLPGLSSRFFLNDAIEIHATTCLLVFSFTSLATWIFWRLRFAVTLEMLLFVTAAVLIFAGHRNFHLDRPKIINSLAWRLHINHLTMLLIIGSMLLVAAICYLFVASRATRPRVDRMRIQRATSGDRGKVWSLTLLVLTLQAGLVFLIQRAVYNHFNQIMLARVANGVGMGNEQGVSPLSFQSALGSTNQPAGLVRLEGDYTDNPFSPMLYLRESALSAFNGREMVFAGRAYDTDLPVIKPQESFTGKEDSELLSRTPVVQSFYLLADHDNAFALDYPVSIVQLKNPKPGRFRSSYRAYSIGPAFKPSEISTLAIGDPRWSPEIRQHYLVAHPDKRYADLAAEVTKDFQSPVEKMRALTDHLSRTAIYTLTPNHPVQQGEDPVAPFLFGDHRGYCVHFAHAIVYMARSLGIPARIATGYLTDLSQAKDGHILLRMSDRHAWAEAYVVGIGWVPFDVQPDQVESHADTQVDSKLLEELMGVLEPGEEILPSETVKDEAGMVDPDDIWTPDMKQVTTTVYSILAAFVALKLLLMFGWRLPAKPSTKLRWGYTALASRLYDLGIARSYGETRAEFAARTPNRALEGATDLLIHATYSKDKVAKLSREDVVSALSGGLLSLKRIPRWKRLLAIINPASVFKFLGGRTW